MALNVQAHDSAVYLDTPEAVEEYLIAAFEDGDPAFISYALGVVARAKGMTELAEKTGLARTSLYRALSTDGHAEFSTILKVADALGFKLTPTRIAEPA